MTILNLSSNSKAYIFDEIHPIQTAVYRIVGQKNQYLIDTYCGSGYLEQVISDIKACGKPLYVINTHSHWDHVWGNCAFSGTPIIAHTICRNYQDTHWDIELLENKKYAKGNTSKTLPSITFDQSLVFEEDGIELLYTPGHSMDSISIYDRNQKILYAGDNLELPLVYINHKNLDLYINTLQQYLVMDVQKYTGNHTLSLTREDIKHIIDYLMELKNGSTRSFDNGYLQSVHDWNLKVLSDNQ